MHVLETEQFLFYTAGKTGTRTLKSIPDIVDYLDPTNDKIGPLRKRAMADLVMRKETTNKQIVAILREPESRMYSGLFEIIGKIISGPFIEEMTNQGADLSFLKNPSIWSRLLGRCIKLSARVWDPHKEFDSHRWQYHIGNWITDIETISEIFPDTIFVNIKDLSKFLEENNITYTYKNKFTNVLPDGEENSAEEIFRSFKFAVDSSKYKQKINDYLQIEKALYNHLNSRHYYIIGN